MLLLLPPLLLLMRRWRRWLLLAGVEDEVLGLDAEAAPVGEQHNVATGPGPALAQACVEALRNALGAVHVVALRRRRWGG